MKASKLLVIVGLLWLCSAQGQNIAASYSNGTLYVANRTSLSMGIEFRGTTQYVGPGQSTSFPYQYTKKKARSTSIRTFYDQKSYNLDLRRVEYIYNARVRRQQTNIFWESILRGLDQFYTGGLIFGIKDATEIYNKIKKGENIDSDIADALLGYMGGKALENELSKAIFSGTYNLATKLGSARNVRTDDLNEFVLQAFNAYENPSRHNRSYRLTEILNPLPKKKDFPHVVAEISMPLLFNYYRDSRNFADPQRATFGDQASFDIRGRYEWALRTRRGTYGAFYGSLGYLRTPIVYNDTKLTGFIIAADEGMNFSAPNLSVGLRYGNQAFWFGGELGLMLLKHNIYDVSFENNTLTSFDLKESESKLRGTARINAGIGNHAYGAFGSIQLFTASRGTVEMKSSTIELGVYFRVLRMGY